MPPIKRLCTVSSCVKRLTFIEKTTCVCSKCNLQYCTMHRLAESHSCSHNFKEDLNREKFIRDNKCVSEKIVKL